MKRNYKKFEVNLQPWITKWSILLCASLLLTNCQTSPVKLSDKTSGHFEAKVLVRDLKHEKTFILYMKANAVNDEHLRVDLTSSLGGHVATIVLNGDELRYLIVPQKKFFVGPAKPESLKNVLAIPMDPRWFYNILFDRPFQSADWKCVNDEKGLLKTCQEIPHHIEIKWSDRMAAQRTVTVSHELGSLQMNFQNYSPKIDAREGLFNLEKP